MIYQFLEQLCAITFQQTTIKLCHYYPERWQPAFINHYSVTIPEPLTNAVPKRLTEFLAGRLLAQQLLAEYNCYQPVAIAEDRSPIWPKGFIGSITHAKGVAAVAVVSVTQVTAIGLDLEYWLTTELASQIQAMVCVQTELESFVIDISVNKKLTMIFSAKEALYKMLYPQVKQFFDFTEAKVINQQGDEQEGVLEIELLRNLSTDYLAGECFFVHYRNDEKKCLTLAKIEAL